MMNAADPAVMIGARAGPQWSFVESLRDEAQLVSRPLARVHHRTIGDAMKMDEYVPTMTPIRKENAKSFRTGPPKKYSASTVSKTVPPVRIVRERFR
jgi:hypothetical protein